MTLVNGSYLAPQNGAFVMELDFQFPAAGDIQVYADYEVRATAHGIPRDNGVFGSLIQAVDNYFMDPNHGKELSPWNAPDPMQPWVLFIGMRVFRAGELGVVGAGNVVTMCAERDYAFEKTHMRWSQIIPLKESEPLHLLLKWSNGHADPTSVNELGHDKNGMCFQAIFHPGGFKP